MNAEIKKQLTESNVKNILKMRKSGRMKIGKRKKKKRKKKRTFICMIPQL